MATPQEFAQQYGPQAAAVGKQIGVDPTVLLGQWGLETGWGRSVVPGTNNLGNIKDLSGAGVAATDNMTGSVDRYRAYDTPDAFGNDFAGLINRRYQGALNAGTDAQAYARALKAGGYAEDADYERKLVAATDLVRKSGGLLDRAAQAVLPSAQAASAPDFGSKVRTAREAGYSDAEIMQHLGQSQGFADRMARAREAGYSDAEIFQHLGLQSAQASEAQPQDEEVARGPDGVMRIEMSQESNPAAAGAPPQERSMLDRIGRQIGLTARAGVTGATGLASMGTNAAISGINSLFGTSIPPADVGATLSAVGLPEPENTVERVAQDVAGGMAGAGSVAQIGQSLAQNAVAPLTRAIGGQLGAGVGTQVASAATGAGAAGVAREEGAGAGGQLAAGLAGSLVAPAVLYGTGAATRGLLRGGEQGRQTVARNLDEFQRAGTTPTLGQATERPVLQGLETVMSQSPGGAGVMAARAAGQVDDIASEVGNIVSRLSPRAGALEAGEAVTRGLEGFKAGVKRVQGQLYDRLDDYIPQNAPVQVDRTRQALAALNSDIDGAPALSQMFKNSRIKGIENALLSDLDSGMTAYGAQASRRSSTLPYESIKKLRTLVGKEIDNTNFTSDVPRDKWRAVYSALSDDLGDAAERAGPEAYDTWRWANQFTRDQVGRLDDLASIAGRDTPEKVFNAAIAGSQDGDTMLRRVVSAIPKENRRELAAAVIQRMGRATVGNQNEAGDVFSTSTFLSNWNRLSPQARETLFGRIDDPKLLGQLENLAKVSTNIRDGSRYLANPSGSGPAAARQALLGAGALAAFTGNAPALGALGAGLVGTNLLSRALTNPNALMRLARPTQLDMPAVLGGLQGLVPRE
ncbi:hypothetical protein CEY09_30520 [Achromobacter marplatensis]|nr:glucosaminidase domain-containing protein [Achromobacter marplatensis]OWT55325.1 hypothetical protein CEY09_30520 [Achromobacter marplatensis]